MKGIRVKAKQRGKGKKNTKKYLEEFSIYEVTSAFLVTGRKREIGNKGTDAVYRMAPGECDASNRQEKDNVGPAGGERSAFKMSLRDCGCHCRLLCGPV